MTQGMIVRGETSLDAKSITDVTIAAFKPLEISNHTEHHIIEALRDAKALTMSIVTEVRQQLVGHIAVSPVTISDGTTGWYGLGPVSVLPEFQKQGIGKALIKEGLSQLKSRSAKGCCLVGHAEYYKQFGFINNVTLSIKNIPTEVFFSLSFDGVYPTGTVSFHEGFMATGQ